jgi:hypothetical protein
MACKCDSCSSPRIIKTRTAMFWRWLAESRGETADRYIAVPERALVATVPAGLTDHAMPTYGAEARRDAGEVAVDEELIDLRRAEFLDALRPRPLS